MFKFIGFMFISLIISSCASNSWRQPTSDLQGGDRLVVKPDWERIERGITTGDFSCQGTCAEVSVDWNKVWRTVSGQEYRNRKEQNLSYCISQYQSQKSNLEYVQLALQKGELSEAQASLINQMTKNSLSGTDSICTGYLGKKPTANLKKEIFGQ